MDIKKGRFPLTGALLVCNDEAHPFLSSPLLPVIPCFPFCLPISQNSSTSNPSRASRGALWIKIAKNYALDEKST